MDKTTNESRKSEKGRQHIQLGLYGFKQDSKRMQLLALRQGMTLEQVQGNGGFEIRVCELGNLT